MSRLSSLTSQQAGVAGTAGHVLAVPLGSTEQHGPHLPLTTDAEIATALAVGLSSTRADVTVAPVLSYGASGEHADFPGTLSIGQAALELLLVELGRSACLTYARLLFVNAHGGNAWAVRRAVAKLRDEGRNVRAWSPDWGGDAHAGRVETSLMLHLAVERVQIASAVAGNVSPVAELMMQIRSGGVAAVSDNGVLGDPAGASAGEGAHMLATAIDELSEWVARWLRTESTA